ncbi:MAG TPA: hypothetical protein VIR65_10735 [Rhizorhapis sp.]
MHEPSLRTSRLVIAGGLGAAIAIAGTGFFLGRMTLPDAEPSSVAQPAPVVPPSLPKIEAPRILSRADIIALGNRAADALTSGVPLPPDVINAAGRRYDVILPFGCDGPAPEESTAPLRWRYDADEQILRVHVASNRWELREWGMAPTDNAETSFQGFWMSRPWSSAERCPHARGQAAATNGQPVTLPGQTLALAEMLPEERRRSDRSYETVQRMPPEQFSPEQGFRLRVTGRIERLPGGKAVQCIQPAGIEQQPICLVAVSFDDIRLENPMNGETLAIWSMHRVPRTSP